MRYIGAQRSWLVAAMGALAAVVLTVSTGCTCESMLSSAGSSAGDPRAKFTVTAVSQGSWEAYRERLQPTFQALTDTALKDVLATTAKAEEKEVEANVLALTLSLPGAALPPTTTTPALNPPLASTLPGISDLGEINLDPMTKYQLAASLFQEIQLLNSYVRDAAIPSGYRAYVARLHLGVMSFRSDQPIDVYATISFFDGAEDADGRRVEIVRRSADKSEARIALLDARERYSQAFPGHTRVIPMLATDSVETALHSRSADRIRELALTLSGGLPNVAGGSLSARDRLDRLNSLLARDFNTTYQVFHDSENSILVKIGASNSASSNRSLVSRTFPVTVVLLVPERLWDPDCAFFPRIDVVAKMTLRDARTGAVIQSPDLLGRAAGSIIGEKGLQFATDNFERLQEELCEHVRAQRAQRKEWRKALKDRACDEGVPAATESRLLKSDAFKLLLAINENNYADYRAVLEAYPDMDQFHEELWTMLLEAVAETGFARTSLGLRSPRGPEHLPPAGAPLPVLFDNGKSSTVTLGHFENLGDPARLSADLRVDVSGTSTTSIALPQQGASVGAAGSALTLQFPSLKQAGIKPEGPAITIRWYDSDTRDWTPVSPALGIPVFYQQVPPPPTPSPYEIVQPVKVVTARHGDPGVVRFTLRRDRSVDYASGKKVGVRIGGAHIRSIAGPGEAVFSIVGDTIIADKKPIGDVDLDVEVTVINFHASGEIELRVVVDGQPVGESAKFAVKGG